MLSTTEHTIGYAGSESNITESHRRYHSRIDISPHFARQQNIYHYTLFLRFFFFLPRIHISVKFTFKGMSASPNVLLNHFMNFKYKLVRITFKLMSPFWHSNNNKHAGIVTLMTSTLAKSHFSPSSSLFRHQL